MATSDWRVAISAGYFHSGHYGLDLLKPQTRRCLVGPANEISLMKGFPFGSFPEGNQCIQKVKRCGLRNVQALCVKTGCVIIKQPQPEKSGIALHRPRNGRLGVL